MRGKFLYANGMRIATARKVFKFYFGDFFLKAEKNDERLNFDVFVKDKIINENKEVIQLSDYVDVEYFVEFWNENLNNPAFNVMIVKVPI